MTHYGAGADLPRFKWMLGHLTASTPKPEGNLTGRVAVVTGATSGLGYACACHFARLNTSTIIFAVRSPEKAKTWIQRLYKEVPSFRGEVKALALDLNRLESVKAFVGELDKLVDRLDFAVLNAGVAPLKHIDSPHGFNQDIQVNVVSTGLLALLLLPKLGATAKLPQPDGATPMAKSQLLVVASEETQKLLLDADKPLQAASVPGFREKIPADEMYQITKLFDVFLARKIGALTASAGVQVTSTSPGLCQSGLRDDFGPVAAWIFNRIAWSAEFGTRYYMRAVLLPHPQGSFISPVGDDFPPSTFACSKEGVQVEERMWAEACGVWKEAAPEVKEVLGA
ncbi:hypothetical protein Rhopal_006352-T1 [Rhodotorula paludigena]|uniref:NAD(P)-binding protein n=1 Tax=Rhodotorula paludigena TaxID=86838 RepID=A0AAV5GL04_9BASI|nr:hypothetical protein Rhopal_006352-T1 [Rhodotorula paludigena]